jgi:hypothetical protein
MRRQRDCGKLKPFPGSPLYDRILTQARPVPGTPHVFRHEVVRAEFPYVFSESGTGGESGWDGKRAHRGLRTSFGMAMNEKSRPLIVTQSSFSWRRPVRRAASVRVSFLLVVPEADTIAPVPAALEVAHRAPGAELFRSAGGHYDVYEGGAGFADVLRTEVDFLHRHAKTAAQKVS